MQPAQVRWRYRAGSDRSACRHAAKTLAVAMRMEREKSSPAATNERGSVPGRRDVAERSELAVRARPRMERLSPGTEHAVGGPFHVETRIEAADLAGPVEQCGDHAAVAQDQQQVAPLPQLYARDVGEGNALPHVFAFGTGPVRRHGYGYRWRGRTAERGNADHHALAHGRLMLDLVDGQVDFHRQGLQRLCRQIGARPSQGQRHKPRRTDAQTQFPAPA